MYKKLSLLIILFFVLVVPIKANAAVCDYSEQNRLNSLGVNVKTDYSVETRQVKEIVSTDAKGAVEMTFDYKYFNVNIYNITNELKIVVENVKTKETKNYTFADVKDGVISFTSMDTSSTVEFKILVYSTNVEFCNDIHLATKTIRLPRTNRFSSYDICTESPGFHLCNEFLNSDLEVDEYGFFKQYEQFLKEKGNNEEDIKPVESVGFWTKTFDFIGKYWYYFVSVVIIIGTVVGVIVATRIRRRDI